MTRSPGGRTVLHQALGRAAAGLLLATGLVTFQPLVARADAGLGPDVTANPAADPAADAADVAGTMADVPTVAPVAPDAAHTATPLEAALFEAVNNDRAQYGLSRLEFDPSLLPVARSRADAQRPQPTLNHYDADGRLAFVKLLAADSVDYVLAGENLARLTGPDDATVFRAEDALMHSPTHRANILEPSYNHMAIGASLDGNGRVIFAQIFRNKAA